MGENIFTILTTIGILIIGSVIQKKFKRVRNDEADDTPSSMPQGVDMSTPEQPVIITKESTDSSPLSTIISSLKMCSTTPHRQQFNQPDTLTPHSTPHTTSVPTIEPHQSDDELTTQELRKAIIWSEILKRKF